MRVRELIEALQKCDPEADCYTSFDEGDEVSAVFAMKGFVVAGETSAEGSNYVELLHY